MKHKIVGWFWKFQIVVACLQNLRNDVSLMVMLAQNSLSYLCYLMCLCGLASMIHLFFFLSFHASICSCSALSLSVKTRVEMQQVFSILFDILLASTKTKWPFSFPHNILSFQSNPPLYIYICIHISSFLSWHPCWQKDNIIGVFQVVASISKFNYINMKSVVVVSGSVPYDKGSHCKVQLTFPWPPVT